MIIGCLKIQFSLITVSNFVVKKCCAANYSGGLAFISANLLFFILKQFLESLEGV